MDALVVVIGTLGGGVEGGKSKQDWMRWKVLEVEFRVRKNGRCP